MFLFVYALKDYNNIYLVVVSTTPDESLDLKWEYNFKLIINFSV